MKSRFIADNQTDMIIEIKQKGTPDLDDGPLDHRCARRLKPRERCGSLCTLSSRQWPQRLIDV